MYKICIVEDEKDLNDLLGTYLKRDNYEVVNLYNGKAAIDYIGNQVDLWILDIMLGDDVSGYDIIKKVREQDEVVPVVFTSARDQELDKIIGLELGSDDYITKPYSPKELVLRVNNIVKRVYSNKNNFIRYAQYFIDLEKRVVSENKKEINLTSMEFDLVKLFIKNQNKSFEREEILTSLWGDNYYGSDRVVDDLVRRVRNKMPNFKIKTIYGFGYRLT